MNEEVFVPVLGYEKTHKISSSGTLIRIKDGKIIIGGDCIGYRLVQLNAKSFYLHRIVANTFIPNPENKKCVNHIDGNKNNNNVENLEWCTYSENMKHAYKNGLIKKHIGGYNSIGGNNFMNKSIDICQYTNDGLFIREWHGIRNASRTLGIHNSAIFQCLRGRTRTSGGFIWKYK